MASDYLLEIEGIKGESGDGKLKECIEIDSFSWGCSNAGTHASGGGGGAGKVSFQDIHFTTSVNKASPLLMLHCCSGKALKKAVLHVRKQGGEQQEFYTITVTDLIITSFQSGGHAGGGAIPTDQFALNFAKIQFGYKPQKDDQTLDAEEKKGWDLKKNEAIA